MSYSWSNSAGPNLLKLGLENPIFVHGKNLKCFKICGQHWLLNLVLYF